MDFNFCKKSAISCVIVLLILPVIPALADSALGTLQEGIGVGKILSVALNSSTAGNWYITASNPGVATAAVVNNSLVMQGITVGVDTVVACTDVSGTNCLTLQLTVSPALPTTGGIPHHKPGSWVLQGKTIFYVAADGIIPVSTWKIFLSNRGKARLIQPANSSDLLLNLLPLMKAKDKRVK